MTFLEKKKRLENELGRQNCFNYHGYCLCHFDSCFEIGFALGGNMTAYELADWLTQQYVVAKAGKVYEATKMLRQQADRIAELEKEIGIQAWLSQTKPLNPKEIEDLAENCWYSDEDLEIFNYQKFAFLLQERHGIK